MGDEVIEFSLLNVLVEDISSREIDAANLLASTHNGGTHRPVRRGAKKQAT